MMKDMRLWQMFLRMMRLPTLSRTGELLASHVPLSLALHDAVPTFCNSGLICASIYSCLQIQVSFTSFTSTALLRYLYSTYKSILFFRISIHLGSIYRGSAHTHRIDPSAHAPRVRGDNERL